ncbi:MAG: flagellar hook-basal body protein [Candidatus Sericytochromatia bacterium]|nr:flagellar hook-basal body protein [Candidatus Sericytochromatia bacterium]
MLKGIYIAASGMNFQMQQLTEVAANMANVNTPGYKRTQLLPETFGDLVTQFSRPTDANRVGLGVYNAGQARWENQGSLVRTNNPLNLAISGDGYFQTQDTNGTVKVTRNGDFRLDAEGYLAAQDGARVLGADNQFIRLGAIATETLRIRPDGGVMSGNNQVAQIKVVGPANVSSVNFPVSLATVPAAQGGYSMEQGFLENSNVNVISEMVNMIALNRSFSFDQKAITIQDNLLNKTVNDLGRSV